MKYLLKFIEYSNHKKKIVVEPLPRLLIPGD